MNIVLEIIILMSWYLRSAESIWQKRKTWIDTRVSKSNTESMQRAWTDRGKLWQVDEKGNDR